MLLNIQKKQGSMHCLLPCYKTNPVYTTCAGVKPSSDTAGTKSAVICSSMVDCPFFLHLARLSNGRIWRK
jgi:hypothetical protein